MMSKNPFLQHDDLRVAKRILAGDRRAFEVFFDDYFDPLFRFALSRLGDENLAKDMVQSTLCRAIEKLDSYRGEAALLSWMFSICRFEISSHFKKHRREASLDLVGDSPEVLSVLEALAANEPSVEDEALQRELGKLVHQTLDYLPKRYGEVLEWKYFEDLPVAEIASRLGVGTKAAESILTRARVAFRQSFQALCRDLAAPNGGRLRLVSTGSGS